MTSTLLDLYLTALTGVAAAAALLPYLNRLRQMTWRSHLWRVVGMHLAWSLWLGWVAFHALALQDADWWHLFGVAGAALWVATSFRDWRQGPPQGTESGPAPLGGPELTHLPPNT